MEASFLPFRILHSSQTDVRLLVKNPSIPEPSGLFQNHKFLAMAGFKAIVFMCIILVARGPEGVVSEGGAKCECGVFKYPAAETTKETPVISKAPQFNFECNADGKESCSNMCKALAGASKDEGPKRICELIEDSDTPFVPVIYYKACNDDAWKYTGLKSTLEICCKAKNVIPCA